MHVDLYGDNFIERQYIPYGIDVVNSARKRLTPTIESAVIGISSLLHHVFNCMEDALLVSLLNVRNSANMVEKYQLIHSQLIPRNP